LGILAKADGVATMTFGENSAAGYAIAIGINQYQHFQPLNYALRDAQALQEFLTGEAEFSPDRVFLLTDTSPTVEQGTTYPNRANVEAALTYIARQPKAGDFLWVFFSGYGVQADGQDYLMPIEGDPSRVRETGIPITTVISILQAATTRNLLLLLDINRSQSAIGSAQVGEQIAAIAREADIPTLLSCQHHQFSHETLALRQGLFTAALLESLRYGGCTTIDHLVQFLSDRLPELSEHHWRPRQEPLAIVTAQQRYQLLLPQRPSRQTASNSIDAAIASQTQAGTVHAGNGKQPLPVTAAIGNGHPTPQQSGRPNYTPTQPFAIASGLPDPPQSPNPSLAMVPVSAPSQSLPTAEEDQKFWRSLLALSGLLFVLLFLGVLFQNRNELTKAPSPLPGSTATATPNADPSVAPTTAVAPTQTPVPSTSPSPAPDDAVAPPTPDLPPPAGVAVPASTQSSALDNVRASLERSIAASPATQISAFNRAIEQARRIPSTDPTYAQAQQDIDRWSQIILAVAERRANQSNGGSRRRAVQNYRAAIEAAQLVPRDRPALYARAQRLIAFCNSRI
jgi:uncharacterized caspase-like protein